MTNLCKKGANCPSCKIGKLSWIRDEVRGGVNYPVYNCPKCGWTCRDEKSPKN